MVFQKYWQSYKRRKALKRVRIGMASLGIDVSGYTDEVVEEMLMKTSTALAHAGMSVGQMIRAFQRFGTTVNDVARVIGE